MSAGERVRRIWRGEAGKVGALVRGLLLPAEGIFRVALVLRERRFALGGGGWRAPVPVVSVGNLSVGGTGKTPVSAWVVGVLREEGRNPALVARGYGRDEMLLHGRWNPGIPVVANPDRRAGAAEARERGADVVVLDDGFQHRRLHRDLDVVLIAAEEGLPGALLPRGPFREPVTALRRAGAVVVTRKEASEHTARKVEEAVRRHSPGAAVARVRLRPGTLVPLAPWGEGNCVEGSSAQGAVTVATGVARPESVVAAAAELGCTVSGVLAFPDHHEFTEGDVAKVLASAGGGPVVVTEKDAVKLLEVTGAGAGDIRVLTQRLEWEAGEDGLRRLLSRLASGGDA